MNFEKNSVLRVILLGALASFSVGRSLVATETPSPALLVVSEVEHTLEIIDPLTNKAVAKVPTGNNTPHLVAVSDDGKLAFVTTNKSGKGNNPDSRLHIEGAMAPNDDYISVIDLVAQKEIRRVQTGPNSVPMGIVFAGGKVYYASNNYKLIGRYDPVSDRIDWMQGTAQGHTHLLVISKDLSKIFAVNAASNSVSAFTPWHTPGALMPPLWEVTTIPVGDAPEGIAMSPDEKEVWVPSKHDSGLAIIDASTLKVKETLNLHTEVPLRLQFTPDGKRVLITNEFDGKVLVIDAATRKEIKRIVVAIPENFSVVNGEVNIAVRNGVAVLANSMLHELLITPDGLRAYIPVMGSGYVAIVDMKALEVTGRFPVGAVPKGLAWAVRK